MINLLFQCNRIKTFALNFVQSTNLINLTQNYIKHLKFSKQAQKLYNYIACLYE